MILKEISTEIIMYSVAYFLHFSLKIRILSINRQVSTVHLFPQMGNSIPFPFLGFPAKESPKPCLGVFFILDPCLSRYYQTKT